MKLITLFLILSGLFMLILSLKPIGIICKRSSHHGWRILFVLTIGFILGYLASALHIAGSEVFSHVYLVHAVILAGGGLFVFLITRFSYKSIHTIEETLRVQQHQAMHDRVTNLENRQSFLKHADTLIQKKRAFTVLLLDLNNFKQINDALGHQYGDALLRNVSRRFTINLPAGCYLYRVGGDEFAVLWRKSSRLDTESVVNKVHQLLADPMELANHTLSLSASIGVSSFPDFSSCINELLQQADKAMYAAKHRKCSYVIFSDELNQGVHEQLSIAARLQTALQNNEFELYYQPVISAVDDSIHGCEALIRWPQADGSFIPPHRFIPIAEQSMLIHEITCWVMQQCQTDLEVLTDHGFEGTVHVNLSAKDMHNEFLTEQLASSDLVKNNRADRIVFEITESTMMSDIDKATEMLSSLSEFGFRFSIDDFGTGFSSFTLLRDLPLSQIKIDRSFVKDMVENTQNQSIVRSVIYLAKSLNCSVVSEGVEDNATAVMLKSLACEYLQGYYFSKPLPLETFVHYCSNKKNQEEKIA